MLTFLKATYYYIVVAPRVLFAYVIRLSNQLDEPLLPQYIEYVKTTKTETVDDILADASFWNSVS